MSTEIEMAKTGSTGGAATAAAEPETKKYASDDYTMQEQLLNHMKGSKINYLYIFVPISFIVYMAKFPAAMIFVSSFLGLIPLAAALGDLTEDIAKRTNDATAALINVTFGNATELIISIVALKYGHLDIIKYSLVGSVLGNMLLVLGTSFLLAGFKNPALRFNTEATATYTSTLILSCFSFVIPTAYSTLDKEATDPKFALAVSRQISFLMIGIYAGYIWFQQSTHKHLFDGEGNDENGDKIESPKEKKSPGSASNNNNDDAAPKIEGATTASSDEKKEEKKDGDDDDDDDEEPEYSLTFGVVATGVVAVLISFLSDFLVDAIDGAAEQLHLSRHFIGLVIVPIVGNVAEHASAIMMAVKGKLDISIGVALGSSVQIGMFVMPLLVLIAWPVGQPLDMNFTYFTTGCLFAAVLLTFSVVTGGSSTWLSGAILTSAYAMLAIAYLNAPDAIEDFKKAAAAATTTAAPFKMPPSL